VKGAAQRNGPHSAAGAVTEKCAGNGEAQRSYHFCSRLNQRMIDVLIFGASFYLAYGIRFGGKIPPSSEYQAWALLVPVMLAGVTVTSLFGIYELVWRFITLKDAILVAGSHSAFCALFLALYLIAPERWLLLRVPKSIILIQFLVGLAGALAVRALRRVIYESALGKRTHGQRRTRAVLVGAGHAGMLVAKELASSPGIIPVGFLDDDPQLADTQICGLRVLGPVDMLLATVQAHQVDEVIICVAREQEMLLRRVWALCEALAVRIRIVPALEEILSGRINVAAFRQVEMHDLMSREHAPVSFTEETAASYRGKRILITGAGGSIGSELAYQLAGFGPEQLLLLDKDENGLNDACLRVHTSTSTVKVHPLVVDLRFSDRIRGVFSRFHPEIVFHAAAHKHVPLMELNPCEAILNNVVSTGNVVEASLGFGVSRFVLISTDKAVRPSSIMGASKRVCEMIVRRHSRSGACRFCCVRFGNVLGSRGSVVPIFQSLIARGHALKLTHADVQRFLMTIPEAVSLLLQAGTLGRAGETFVLDMGEPVLIRDVAKRLIEHCGLRPGRDIPIEISRLGPGEKLSEELFDDSTEKLLPTSVAKINVIQSAPEEGADFSELLHALERAAREDRPSDIKQILRAMNIGFRPEEAAAATQAPEEDVYTPAPARAASTLQARTAKQG
jgi:FlaA1/EpsC-like NDP-sugar epimerase